MALAHNLLIRYLNSIYLQATGISRSEDVEAFLFYCQAWCTIIHEHHHGEENIFFPTIAEYTAKKDIMNTSVEQHKDFDSGMQKFEKYVTETPSNAYSGSMLRKLVDDFAPALVKHLHAEISTLLSVGEEFGGEKLQKSYDEWEKQIMKESRAKSDPVFLSFSSPTSFFLTDLTVYNATCRFWRS
jgi:hemerythrin-like domain-containing protein